MNQPKRRARRLLRPMSDIQTWLVEMVLAGNGPFIIYCHSRCGGIGLLYCSGRQPYQWHLFGAFGAGDELNGCLTCAVVRPGVIGKILLFRASAGGGMRAIRTRSKWLLTP